MSPPGDISRRDLLQGAAVTALASGLAPELARAAAAERAAQDVPGYYPPLLTGMRGSHAGSFEAAHALRDGDFWSGASAPQETGERYDLIVVGGGISGLSAAHFWLNARPGARVLVLENHDDFGGHAKRNEFHLDGGLQLMNGGTLSIESPYPYSPVADGLMQELGCRPAELAAACDHPQVYARLGLTPAMFFDQATFGADRLVKRAGAKSTPAEVAAFAAAAPLSDGARRSLVEIETGDLDPWPGLDSDAKKDRLSRISYRDFLLQGLKADPGVIPLYARRTDGLWGCGIDAVSALDCWATGLPGFQGLKLQPGATARMGYTPAGYAASGGSYSFHYPDGNASVARMLVRRLVPGALTGSTAQDIVTARADYGRLDRADNAVRIRLSSIVVRARNLGDPAAPRGVEVAYTRGGRPVPGARVGLRAGLLEHDDPLPVPGAAGGAEGGAAFPGEDAAGLHQRGGARLARLRPAGGEQRLRAGELFQQRVAERGGGHRRLHRPAQPWPAHAAAPDAHPRQAGPARARAAQGRPLRAAVHPVRDVRAQRARSA